MPESMSPLLILCFLRYAQPVCYSASWFLVANHTDRNSPVSTVVYFIGGLLFFAWSTSCFPVDINYYYVSWAWETYCRTFLWGQRKCHFLIDVTHCNTCHLGWFASNPWPFARQQMSCARRPQSTAAARWVSVPVPWPLRWVLMPWPLTAFLKKSHDITELQARWYFSLTLCLSLL